MASDQNNKRENNRAHMSMPAKIIFNDRQSVFDCVLEDLSSGGAHVKMVSTLGVPQTFTLLIPCLEESHRCWLVWSNLTEIGIAFSPRDYRKGKPDLRVV